MLVVSWGMTFTLLCILEQKLESLWLIFVLSDSYLKYFFLFLFWWSQFIFFFHCFCCGVISQKPLPTPRSWKFKPEFCFKNFIVLVFKFRSSYILSYFLYMIMRCRVPDSFLFVCISSCACEILEKTIISPLELSLIPLFKINWGWVLDLLLGPLFYPIDVYIDPKPLRIRLAYCSFVLSFKVRKC